MANKFKRLHIPSGTIYEGEFNASHHMAFTEDQARYFSPRMISRIKLEIINDWNRQMPKHWKYWLEDDSPSKSLVSPHCDRDNNHVETTT